MANLAGQRLTAKEYIDLGKDLPNDHARLLFDQVVVLRDLLVETQDTIRDAANGGEPRFGDLWRKIEAALTQKDRP